MSSVNHQTEEHNQSQVSMVGWEGAAQGPLEAPASFYNPPACPSVSSAALVQPTRATAKQEGADIHHLPFLGQL